MKTYALLMLYAFAAAPAVAQTGGPTRPVPPIPSYEVRRAVTRISLDGRLDDSAWKNAGSIELLFPWESQTGAKQKTIARLLWDDSFLYVGYDCDDADVVALYDSRDDPTYRDDAVEIFINPNPNQLDFYYGLEMNARATLYDYFYAFPKLLLKRINFTGVQLATFIRGTLNSRNDKDDGWSLELAIPWVNFEELTKTLPPALGTTWSIALNRWDGVEPDRRLSLWSDSGSTKPTPHVPSRFGRITFVK